MSKRKMLGIRCKGLVVSFIFIILHLTLYTFHGFCAGAGSSTGMGLLLEQMACARAGGMAQAVSAIEQDINLVRYNPAGLATIDKKEIGFAYLLGFGDMSFVTGSYGQPLLGGVIAGSLSYFNAGNIVLSYADGTDHTFNAQSDIVATVSYARELLKDLPVGVNVKFLSSTLLGQFTGTSIACDVGTIYRTPIKNLKAGVSIQNIGTRIKYYQTEENIPMNLRAGASYSLNVSQGMGLLAAVEFNYLINDVKLITSIGGELKYGEVLTIRGGYIIGTAQGLTLGAGFNIKNYIIDYAFELAPDVASFGNHRIGFRMGL